MGLLASKAGGQSPGAARARVLPLEEPRTSLCSGHFSGLFRLFLSAFSHEIGNSLQTFRLMAQHSNGLGDDLVNGMVDDFKRLRLLGEVASKPVDSNMASEFNRLFPERLFELQDLDDFAKDSQVRSLSLSCVMRLEQSICESGRLFRDAASRRKDLKFHFNRVMAYGSLICQAIRKIILDDFDFSSECGPQKALGRGSVAHACAKAVQEASLKIKFCEIDASIGQACVRSNPLILRLILANVCSNAKRALEASGADPLVRVFVNREGDGILIRFADSGCGMDSETRDKLNSGVQTSTKAETGHGVGFSYCRSLAEKIGGELYVESSEPGKGSVVALRLEITDRAPDK
ncbi:ATP-binding protein [Candidatus Micrarchaeota archaeon]|nr:ATP-binding protein [Candidatus Micrarchaeota archaeon]